MSAIQHVALIRALADDLALPLTVAVPLAKSLLANETEECAAGPWLRIAFDRAAFLRRVDERIAEGVEAMIPVRRGRPPTGREAK